MALLQMDDTERPTRNSGSGFRSHAGGKQRIWWPVGLPLAHGRRHGYPSRKVCSAPLMWDPSRWHWRASAWIFIVKPDSHNGENPFWRRRRRMSIHRIWSRLSDPKSSASSIISILNRCRRKRAD